ncbi:FAD/FMN-binding dehydrogenase [Metarhizium robertsii]|uniref:FAD-dependent oxygenase n=2 Tax=Metarhizium robertsii TaxID=568076 RepID=E9F4G6_METRA|nr:FAD-dependent oxygenase [Metarhizium robertsii ARSEF 23]EFY97523.1 FAD-dependent oxygenase [Metarhizium robertsii ARSEF 23]EXU99655.1 FAD/FMN-binding dehydrogenase [Metarhizium robertsii]
MTKFKMEVVAAVAAWALTSACTGLPAVRDLVPGLCPRDIDEAQALQSSLSPGAKVYFPGSPEFDDASTRWSTLSPPTVNVVVVAATAKDVSETVKYANRKKLPFLAYNSAHGAITTLGRMKSGVEIYLDQLNTIEVAEDGQTATIGGGALSKHVTDTLWDAGKQTGNLMGPALGGGHGWLQGHHGLVADQFVSMDVVLADGELQTVDAESDLWWALNGAGHNFGIVTSVTTKVYDIEHRDWAIETIVFSGDKVGAVYDAANKHLLQNGTQAADVINWSYWLHDAAADPNNPIILFYIIQEGVKAVDARYTQPFHDLGPVAVTPLSGTYKDLAGWTGIALSSPPCQKAGLANPRFPIYLQSYNVEAQEEAYEAFANATRGSSAFNGSLFMFEGYPVQGVQAVDGESSAFAFREAHLLAAPLITYKPDGAELDKEAGRLGNRLRDILHRASGLCNVRAYVNYAYGNENPKVWYGSAKWRQERLKELKKQYDPLGKFSFFGPIA